MLQQNNITEQNIDQTEDNHKLEVKFNGKIYHIIPTKSLLRDLRKVNVSIPSGCLMGICGTCRVNKLKGEIDYTSQPLFPLKDMQILTCIGKAKTDLELEEIKIT